MKRYIKDYLINYKNNSVFEQTQIDTKTTIPKNIKETIYIYIYRKKNVALKLHIKIAT